MVRRFHESGRSGFYLAVLSEGEVGGGDPIESRRDHFRQRLWGPDA